MSVSLLEAVTTLLGREALPSDAPPLMMTRTWFEGEKPEPASSKMGRKAKMNLVLGGHAFVSADSSNNTTKAESMDDPTQHVLLSVPVPKHCNHLLK